MSEFTRKKILSDYDRMIRKSYKKSKAVPQLGMQSKQSVDPMPSDVDINLQQFMADTGFTPEQLLGISPIPKASTAELRQKFKLTEPFVKPEQVNTLSTQLYRFHTWYME